MIQHHRDYRRVIVSVNNKAKTLQSETKIPRIESNALETLKAGIRGGNLTEGRKDLHQHWRSWRFPICHSCVCDTEFLNYGFGCGDIATISSERFGKCSHENVDF